MKVALAVYGSRGDIQPTLALGRALMTRGCDVVLCATPEFEQTAAEAGVEFAAVGRNVRDFLARNSKNLGGGVLRSLPAFRAFFAEEIGTQFTALARATADCDLIIGAGMQFVAGSVAEHHRVPYRFLAFTPTMLVSHAHAPPSVPLQGLPRILNRALWWTTGQLYDRLFLRTINTHRARLGLPPRDNIYEPIVGERPLLAVDRAIAPCPDTLFETVQTGYLYRDDCAPLPAALEAFLSDGPPPIYIGFGSMPAYDPAATTAMVAEAIGRAGCRGVISAGWADLGRTALPPSVHAIGPVSHELLFPRCAAIVHHGGAGTTAAAARAGVPQVVVPHLMDQHYYAYRVATLGIGPRGIRRSRLTAKRLTRAICRALGESRMRARAAAVARAIRREDPVANAVREILG